MTTVTMSEIVVALAGKVGEVSRDIGMMAEKHTEHEVRLAEIAQELNQVLIVLHSVLGSVF